MQDLKVKALVKKCIDLTPTMQIRKKKDLKAIEETTIMLERFHLDLYEHEPDDNVNPLYAQLSCSIDWEPAPGEPGYIENFFVSVVTDASEANADIFMFGSLLNGLEFINQLRSKYSMLCDFERQRELNLVLAHHIVKERKKNYKGEDINDFRKPKKVNG